MREMTNTISLVSKEFCLQWIGIDVSLSRCVRLLCDIYFNEFGFIFILISDLFFCKPCSYYKVCITRLVNDLWTCTMFIMIRLMQWLLLQSVVFVYVMIENESESRVYKYMYFCCHEVIRWILWFVYIHVL